MAGQTLHQQPGAGSGSTLGREVIEHEAAGAKLVHVRRVTLDDPVACEV